MKKLFRWLIALMLIAYVAGFVVFVELMIPQEKDIASTPNGQPFAMAVALTGGAGRLEEGLKALNQGWAKKLFISGVFSGTDVREIMGLYKQNEANIETRVVLGHQALDTRGNAREIAGFLDGQDLEDALVITAAYHMPRALLVLEDYAPNVDFVPWPVFPDHIKQVNWWNYPSSAWFLFKEYTQYLLTWLTLPFSGG